MSNKLDKVQRLVEKDPAFLGMLITNPKKALEGAKIKLTEEKDFISIERFAFRAQKDLVNNAQALGFKVCAQEKTSGIGFKNCCNSKRLE
jgi:hypothetical protein